jgi:hypothetical protein
MVHIRLTGYTLDARTNFALGLATTLSAGMGAIFTAADTVRALSGTAAILSGTRAEFNEVYFSKQTIQVLTEALEVKRRKVYAEIKKGQRRNIDDYTIQAAIKDAVTYHANCSLIAGLEQAAISVQREENPGIKGAQRALIEAKRLQYIMGTKPENISKLDLSGPFDGSGASDMQALSELDLDSPLNVLAERLNQTFLVRKSFGKKINELIAEAKDLPDAKDPIKVIKMNATNDLTGLVSEVRKTEEKTREILKSHFQEKAEAADLELRKIQMDWAFASTDASKKVLYAELQGKAHSAQSISYEIIGAFEDYSGPIKKVVGQLKEAWDQPLKDLTEKLGGAISEADKTIKVVATLRNLQLAILQRVKDAIVYTGNLSDSDIAKLAKAINDEKIPNVSVVNKLDILTALKKVKGADTLESFATAYKKGVNKTI